MRILVIGASGFLGGHVRRAADARGIEVVAPAHHAVDLATGSAELARLIAEVAPRAVVNCAGAVAGDAATLNATNVVGTENLVRAIGPGIRLVHLGSASGVGSRPLNTAAAYAAEVAQNRGSGSRIPRS